MDAAAPRVDPCDVPEAKVLAERRVHDHHGRRHQRPGAARVRGAFLKDMRAPARVHVAAAAG